MYCILYSVYYELLLSDQDRYQNTVLCNTVCEKMVTVQVSSDYGYVVLVVAGTWVLNIWQMMKVGESY